MRLAANNSVATQPGSARSAGKWRSFTGNETGVLLAHWLFTCWQRQHEGADPGRVAMLASTVSSRMLAVVAKVPSCYHCSAPLRVVSPECALLASICPAMHAASAGMVVLNSVSS